MSKVCNNCGKEKELLEYDQSKSGRLGVANVCKPCRKEARDKLKFERKKEGTKVCSMCNQDLDVSKFNADRTLSDGLQSCCKDCGKEKHKKWGSTFDGFLTNHFKDIRGNAKRRNIEVNITIDDIKEQYDKQEGKCIYLKKPMTYSLYGEDKGQHIKNPYNISVDRIDSTKDYEKDNIQLVCAIVNRLKGDKTNEEFLKICHKIRENCSDRINEIKTRNESIAQKN